VTVPSISTSSGSITGTGSYIGSVSSLSLSINTTGLAGKTITVFASFTGSVTSITEVLTGNQLYINGSLVQETNNTSNSGGATLAGAITFLASGGTDIIPVHVDWKGANSAVHLNNRVLYAQAAKR
jgi:hypothetical protein